MILLNYTRNHVTVLESKGKQQNIDWKTVIDMLKNGTDIIGLKLRGTDSIVDTTGRTLYCSGWYKQ